MDNLNFEPQYLSFSWQNIKVEVLEKTKTFWKTIVKKKTILDDGTTVNNSLIAVLGSSGSGKTTLLSAISGRSKSKTGIIKINNTIISDNLLKNISGYMYQQDIFTEYMTVIEHLQFMAALQLSDKTKEKRLIIIKKLISELSLENQKCTLIKNLSGGQKRRLSLAGELCRSPIILFCDEPTTGLDSYSAVLVVQKLQAVALSGKIVIVTIHQPSSQLFQYFDNIALLAEGRLVFQGTKEEVKSFFESMGFVCPPSYNPADYYLKYLAYEDISKMCDAFNKQQVLIKEECRNDHANNVSLEKKNSIFYELKWLLWRCYIQIKRNKTGYLGGYICVLFDLIAVAIFYGDLNFNDDNSVHSIEGLLAFLASEFTFTNMYAVVDVFPGEIAVFLREKNVYSCYAYYISKILSLVPLTAITTIIYMSIFFCYVKFLKGIYLWAKMTYMIFLVSMASCGLGLAFSAAVSSVEYVDLYLGPSEFILLLFSGFFIRLNTIHFSLSWIKYISPFYYAFDSLSNLLWRNVTNFSNCTEKDTFPCFNNGTQVLQNYGIYKTYDTVIYNIFYVHILGTVLCVIGFIGIWRKKKLFEI